MHIKTADLTGRALDWAVASLEGATYLHTDGIVWHFTLNGRPKVLHLGWARDLAYSPSTAWAQGGPLIELGRIDLFRSGAVWDASTGGRHPNVCQSGPTPLVAAMRCLVASRLGESVDIPEGLL